MQLFVFGMLWTGLAAVRGAPPADPALRVGHTKQLFIDDLVIGSVTDLSRKVHEPSRHAGKRTAPRRHGDQPAAAPSQPLAAAATARPN